MAAGIGLKVSAAAWLGLQVVSEFVETSTEARGGLVTFEATHRSVLSLDPTMVLFDSIVQILISPMFYTRIQFSPDCAWVTVVTVRRDTLGSDAGHRFGRSEGRLGCRHVALLAQPDFDKGTRTIDGTIKIAPSTVHLDVCLVNVPALADPPFTPPPEVIDERRRRLRLPIANHLIVEFDTPDQEHLWQIAQAQLVAKPPKDHECDDVGWILSAIENSTAAFIELLTTGAAGLPQDWGSSRLPRSTPALGMAESPTFLFVQGLTRPITPNLAAVSALRAAFLLTLDRSR
jgi:hypothetical protein